MGVRLARFNELSQVDFTIDEVLSVKLISGNELEAFQANRCLHVLTVTPGEHTFRISEIKG